MTSSGPGIRSFQLGVIDARGGVDLTCLYHEPQDDLEEAQQMAESLARTSRRTIGVFVVGDDPPVEVGRASSADDGPPV